MIVRTRSILLTVGTLCLLLAACSASSPLEKSLRGTVPDVQVQSKGDESFARTREGNLGDATVYSSEERRIQLEDFINKHKSDLGIPTADVLEFVQPDREFDFEFSEKLLTAVALYQYINGMRILDRKQTGVFDLESGMLKAVRIQVVEPALLKGVPAPKTNEGIRPLAAKFLETEGIVCSEMTALDDPAYSVATRMAGFEVRCTARTNSQSFMRIRLLVNTDSGKAVFLSKEEIDVPE